jgi:hypothetical protein
MNPTCEKDNLFTSRILVLSKGEVTAVASNIVRHRQGILETTRLDYGYEVDIKDTCKKPNARVQSYPTCLHTLIKESYYGRESAVERLHSRQNPGTPVIPDSPSPQSRNRLQMSEGSSSVSAKESHKDPGVGDTHQRRSSASKWLQQSDSKWNSGSGTLTDRPPLPPFSRHGIIGASDESRWSSGCHH